MSKCSYFAGEAAEALGVSPVTLRMWRDRGYSALGSVDVGMESNPRARRHYTTMEICQMAVAIALNHHGFGLEEAFNVAGGQELVAALAGAIAGTAGPDTVITYVGSDDGGDRRELWSNLVFLSLNEWKTSVPTLFEAKDPLAEHETEIAFVLNVSSIARRILRRLSDAEQDGAGKH